MKALTHSLILTAIWLSGLATGAKAELPSAPLAAIHAAEDACDYQLAEKQIRTQLAACQAHPEKTRPDTIANLNIELCRILLATERWREGYALCHDSIAVCKTSQCSAIVLIDLQTLLIRFEMELELFKAAEPAAEQIRKNIAFKHTATAGYAAQVLARAKYFRGDCAGWQRYSYLALTDLSNALGPAHPDVLSEERDFANIFVSRGYYRQAETLMRKADQDAMAKWGASHPINIKNKIALHDIFLALDQQELAKVACDEAVAISKSTKLSNTDLAAVFDLEGSHEESQEHYTSAEELFTKAINLRTSATGAQTISNINELYELASMKVELSKFDEAVQLMNQAIEQSRTNYGPVHSETISMTRRLAKMMRNHGDANKAYDLCRKLLPSLEGLTFVDPIEAANTRLLLSNVCEFNLEKPVEAETLARSALGSLQVILRPDHDLIISALRVLGNANLDQKKYSEANKYLQQAVQLCGDQKLKTGTKISILKELARAIDLSGDYPHSSEIFRQALALAASNFGAGDSRVADILISQARLDSDNRRFAQAEPLARRALDIYDGSSGLTNEGTLKALKSLARIYFGLERLIEAERTEELIVQQERKLYGDNDKRLADNLLDLATVQGKNNSSNERIESLVAAAKILNHLKDPDEINALQELADECLTHDVAQADRCYERVLTLVAASHGENSKEVESVLFHINQVANNEYYTSKLRPLRLKYLTRLRNLEETKSDQETLSAIFQKMADLQEDPKGDSAVQFLESRIKAVNAAWAKDGVRRANAYIALAEVCTARNEPQRSADNYRVALNLLRDSLPAGDDQIKDCADNLSKAYKKLGREELAAVTREPEPNWKIDFIEAENKLREGDLQGARKQAEKAVLECGQARNAKVELAHCLRLSALIESSSKNNESARDFYQQAIKLQQDNLTNNSVDLFITRWRFASFLWSVGDTASALRLSAIALKEVDPQTAAFSMPCYSAQPFYEATEILLKSQQNTSDTSPTKVLTLAEALAKQNEPVLAARLYLFVRPVVAATSAEANYAEQKQREECEQVEAMIRRRIESYLHNEIDDTKVLEISNLLAKTHTAQSKGDLVNALNYAKQFDARLNELPEHSYARAYSGWLTASVLSRNSQKEESEKLYLTCLEQAQRSLPPSDYRLLVFASASNLEQSNPIMAIKLYEQNFGAVLKFIAISQSLYDGPLYAHTRLRSVLHRLGDDSIFGLFLQGQKYTSPTTDLFSPADVAIQIIEVVGAKKKNANVERELLLMGGLQSSIDAVNASILLSLAQPLRDKQPLDESRLIVLLAEQIQARKYDLPLEVSPALLEAARLCQQTGKLIWANNLLESAMQYAERKNDDILRARCQNIEADIALQERNYDKASQIATSTLASISGLSGASKVLSDTYDVLVRASIAKGDLASAIMYAANIDKLTPREGATDRNRSVRTLMLLSESSLQHSNRNAAGQYLKQAYDLANQSKSEPTTITTKCELLISYIKFSLGNNDVTQAAKQSKELLALQSHLNLTDSAELAAISQNMCALVANKQGDNELARRLIFQSSAILDHYCDLIFQQLSFAEQTEFAKVLENQRDYLLSFCTEPKDIIVTYGYISKWKGLLIEVLRLQSAILRMDDKNEYHKQLSALRAKLADAIGTPAATTYFDRTESLERRIMLSALTETNLEDRALATANSAQSTKMIEETAPSMPPTTVTKSTQEEDQRSAYFQRILNNLAFDMAMSNGTLKGLLYQNDLLKIVLKQKMFEASLSFELNDFSKLLKEDQRLIDLSEYRDLKTGEQKYAAIIIGSDPSSLDNTRIITLGNTTSINASLKQWLDTAQNYVQSVYSQDTKQANRSSARKRDVVIDSADPGRQSKVTESAARAALRANVWEPLQKALPESVSTVWLCVDGELARVPWQLFQQQKQQQQQAPRNLLVCQIDSPRQFRKLRRVEQKFDVKAVAVALDDLLGPSNSPIASAETEDKSTKDDKADFGDQMLLVGNLDFLNAPRLPGTVREIDHVSKIMEANGINSTVLTKSDGNREAVLAALLKCTYAHFATHGYFYQPSEKRNETDASSLGPSVRSVRSEVKTDDAILRRSALLQSGLLLAPDKSGGAGRLSAAELLDVDLSKCKLLVLSACETGRGAEITGQGVIGLRASAIAAGAHTVLMSLWKVSDDATEQLMSLFYENLLQRKLNPYSALLEAQHTLQKIPRFAHPYYWAGWVVVGSDQESSPIVAEDLPKAVEPGGKPQIEKPSHGY